MVGRFLSFLVGAAGAVGASQAPGFTVQYMQNLDGRVAELRTIVERFEENIARIGYDREEALTECGQADPAKLLGALCDGITQDIARYERLSAHQAELSAAADWARPVVLARNFERDIAESAKDRYEPVVPTTPEGAGYAAAGFAGLWGVASILFGIIGGLFRREAY